MFRIGVLRAATLIACVAVSAVSCFHDSDKNDKLELKFVDAGTMQPLIGVVVVLYNEDDKTYSVDNVKATGGDGMAAFDDPDRTNGTLTVYHSHDGGSGNLMTWVDFPLVDATIPLATPDNGYEECEQSASLNLSAIPAGTYGPRILPVDQLGFDTISSPTAAPLPAAVASSFSVCSRHIQTDGKISLLALASNSASDPAVFGFAIYQPFADSATFTLDLDKATQSVAWTTQPATLVDYFHVSGWRKDVWYGDLSARFSSPGVPVYDDASTSNGTVRLPLEFPFEGLGVSAYAYSPTDEHDLATTVPLAAPDRSLTAIEVPFDLNVRFQNPWLDVATGTLRWTLSGDGSHDEIILYVNVYDDYTEQNTLWTVVLPPGSQQWHVPGLPIMSYVHDAVLHGSEDGDAEITYVATDYARLNGIGDAWVLKSQTLTTLEPMQRTGTVRSVVANPETALPYRLQARSNRARDTVMRRALGIAP